MQSQPTPWLLLRSGSGTAIQNMALDHALLEGAAAWGQPVLRFYGWSEPAASFGYFQKHDEIAKLTGLRPLVRRPTGGGLVPHAADWTYAVAAPPGSDWYGLTAVASYHRIHEWIQQAFGRLGIATELAPCCRKEAPGQCFVGYEKSDVLWQGRKVGGAAQRRTREGLLIQGSVQPPPLALRREDWEGAMVDVGREKGRIEWTDLAWTAVLETRVAELVGRLYGREEYIGAGEARGGGPAARKRMQQF